MKKTKIFGIGFHKTGTSTLASVLEHYGYKVCGIRHDLVPHLVEKNHEKIYKVIEEYDAFQDNPWPLIFKELDQKYPGSKFVLTYRDDEKWLKSVLNHFGNTSTDMRKFIYGVGYPKGQEQIYRDRYNQHNDEVRAYFKDRPGDLLEINWETEKDWERIANFLGEKAPNNPLPYANKGNYTFSNKLKLRVKKMIKKIIRRK